MTLPFPAASPLALRLFGPFEVRLNGVPLPRLRSRKGQSLLALLVLRQGSEVERDWLAGLLWPEGSTSQVRALERLAAAAMARGDPGTAEGYLRRAVAVDPLQETAQRARMQALAAGGNYAAALLAYRELRLLLHRELNAEPDAATAALFQQ